MHACGRTLSLWEDGICTHGEFRSHISLFSSALTIGGRSSPAVEHCLCVCLLVLFLTKRCPSIKHYSGKLLSHPCEAESNPETSYIADGWLNALGGAVRAKWSWETLTNVNVIKPHQWSSDLTYGLYEEKLVLLAKGHACCHQRLETNDKSFPELILVTIFIFWKTNIVMLRKRNYSELSPWHKTSKSISN